MEESKHRCYGCGGTFIRKELHYRPSGRGAYRRELYFCQICNEKENKNKHCALQVLHSVKRSLQGLATLITAVKGDS